MLKLGDYNTLEVIRKEEHGFYLDGDEKWGDILLPNKYVPEGLNVGDDLKVFLYFDSEDMIIATTLTPFAKINEFAALEVKAVESIGVFLDWGLEKDLFVPFREQIFEMHLGKKYVVYVYLDSSDRIAASTRINKFISTTPAPFKDKQKVDLLPYQVTDLGVSAIVEGTHSGLIYTGDILQDLPLAIKVTGYIKKVREDNKIDLSLQPDGLGGRFDLADQILEKLKEADGTLSINSKTPADTISSMFNVSRKKFKVALGHLYKKELITMTDDGIALKK